MSFGCFWSRKSASSVHSVSLIEQKWLAFVQENFAKLDNHSVEFNFRTVEFNFRVAELNNKSAELNGVRLFVATVMLVVDFLCGMILKKS